MAKPKSYKTALLLRSSPKPGIASRELCRVDLFIQLDEVSKHLYSLMERYGAELGDAKIEEGSLSIRLKVELPPNYHALIKAVK